MSTEGWSIVLFGLSGISVIMSVTAALIAFRTTGKLKEMMQTKEGTLPPAPSTSEPPVPPQDTGETDKP